MINNLPSAEEVFLPFKVRETPVFTTLLAPDSQTISNAFV